MLNKWKYVEPSTKFGDTIILNIKFRCSLLLLDFFFNVTKIKSRWKFATKYQVKLNWYIIVMKMVRVCTTYWKLHISIFEIHLMCVHLKISEKLHMEKSWKCKENLMECCYYTLESMANLPFSIETQALVSTLQCWFSFCLLAIPLTITIHELTTKKGKTHTCTHTHSRSF